MAEKWQEDMRAAFEKATRESNVSLRDASEDSTAFESAESAPEPEEEEHSTVDDEPRPFETVGRDDPEETQAEDPETEEPDEEEALAEDEALTRAVRRARAYIKLKVSPPDSALDQDPDALLDWADRIKEQERWVEDLKAERANQRRSETAQNGEQEPAPVDLARELIPFLEELGLDAGSRAGQALLAALRAGLSPVMARLQDAESTLRQREIRDMERELEGHRRRLAKTVPLLGKSRHAWRAVTILGAQMAQSEELSDRDALERAVYEIYGERPLPKNGKGDKVALTTQRPTVETQKVRSRPPTLDEWNRASFDYILARGGHAEPHEVERALLKRFGHHPSRPRPKRY